MVGVLLALVILKVLWVVLSLGNKDDGSRVEIYDENGNVIGVMEKIQEDIDENF